MAIVTNNMAASPSNTAPVPAAHREIMAELSRLIQLLAQMGIDTSSHMTTVLQLFLKQTEDQVGSMRLQAGVVFAVALLGGCSQVALGALPNTWNVPPLGNSPLARAAHMLVSPTTVLTALKTCSTACPVLSQGAQMSLQPSITHQEAKRALTERVNLSQAQKEEQQRIEATRALSQALSGMAGKNWR